MNKKIVVSALLVSTLFLGACSQIEDPVINSLELQTKTKDLSDGEKVTDYYLDHVAEKRETSGVYYGDDYDFSRESDIKLENKDTGHLATPDAETEEERDAKLKQEQEEQLEVDAMGIGELTGDMY